MTKIYLKKDIIIWERGRFIIKKKNQRRSKKLIVITIVLTLILIVTVYLNYIKEKEIMELNDELKVTKEKAELANLYEEKIPQIKELKQKIMGQENKIEELTDQIQEVTNLLQSNTEKLEKLENK